MTNIFFFFFFSQKGRASFRLFQKGRASRKGGRRNLGRTLFKMCFYFLGTSTNERAGVKLRIKRSWTIAQLMTAIRAEFSQHPLDLTGFSLYRLGKGRRLSAIPDCQTVRALHEVVAKGVIVLVPHTNLPIPEVRLVHCANFL